MARHDHFHELFCRAVAVLAFNKHFVDLAAVKIADRALDEVAFLINLRWRDGFQRQFADLLPHALQVFVVAFDLGFGALGSGSPNDQARTLRHVDFVCDLFELLAV